MMTNETIWSGPAGVMHAPGRPVDVAIQGEELEELGAGFGPSRTSGPSDHAGVLRVGNSRVRGWSWRQLVLPGSLRGCCGLLGASCLWCAGQRRLSTRAAPAATVVTRTHPAAASR
jgi:hypothetical protein